MPNETSAAEDIPGAQKGQTVYSRPSRNAVPTVVTAYLNNIVIELMPTNSINRLTIKSKAFRDDVFREAGAAQAISDLLSNVGIASSGEATLIAFRLRPNTGPRTGSATESRRTKCSRINRRPLRGRSRGSRAAADAIVERCSLRLRSGQAERP